jgi:hypothetical protein
VGIGVYIELLETQIVRKALFLGIRFEQKTQVDTDTFDRTMDADRAADEKSIAESGGAAIGGSIISAGERYGGFTDIGVQKRNLDRNDRGVSGKPSQSISGISCIFSPPIVHPYVVKMTRSARLD